MPWWEALLEFRERHCLLHQVLCMAEFRIGHIGIDTGSVRIQVHELRLLECAGQVSDRARIDAAGPGGPRNLSNCVRVQVIVGALCCVEGHPQLGHLA
jgi:hypothetical protein